MLVNCRVAKHKPSKTTNSQHLFFCEGFEDETKYSERTFEVYNDL